MNNNKWLSKNIYIWKLRCTVMSRWEINFIMQLSMITVCLLYTSYTTKLTTILLVQHIISSVPSGENNCIFLLTVQTPHRAIIMCFCVWNSSLLASSSIMTMRSNKLLTCGLYHRGNPSIMKGRDTTTAVLLRQVSQSQQWW